MDSTTLIAGSREATLFVYFRECGSDMTISTMIHVHDRTRCCFIKALRKKAMKRASEPSFNSSSKHGCNQSKQPSALRQLLSDKAWTPLLPLDVIGLIVEYSVVCLIEEALIGANDLSVEVVTDAEHIYVVYQSHQPTLLQHCFVNILDASTCEQQRRWQLTHSVNSFHHAMDVNEHCLYLLSEEGTIYAYDKNSLHPNCCFKTSSAESTGSIFWDTNRNCLLACPPPSSRHISPTTTTTTATVYTCDAELTHWRPRFYLDKHSNLLAVGRNEFYYADDHRVYRQALPVCPRIKAVRLPPTVNRGIAALSPDLAFFHSASSSNCISAHPTGNWFRSGTADWEWSCDLQLVCSMHWDERRHRLVVVGLRATKCWLQIYY